ncbi:GNAT family N-acetyltransferase [Caproiciproducens galactitolivorans]|uniref:GNAT family N-acetyltransferase n=1 Tax=Caproiciproducens galactitolivorans TaxID=642589 RepID=A0ABT4BQT4_9FIRM|nr:GNAT family N-acetyltransferase [Caproiciproducens galactitolivorans]MCY1713257.1 GNAT family N-acetyltransferase [Caproiciproducens galactitolivorans]
MEFITVNRDNIDREHICCAIAEKRGETCVSSKKAWMKERFQDGLVFRKLDARGKVFIEYIPAEKAWCPILADGYMHINCFWVSGQFKGQGYANQLLEQCIADAKKKGKRGLTVLSSTKKMPFLSDPKYLKYKGFQIADTAAPYYELLYLPFDENAPVPKFRDCARQCKINEKGMVLYYANQCPHTDKYAPMIREIAEQHSTTVTLHKIETTEQAQNAPAPFTTYSFFYDGVLVTNEIFSDKKFEKFLASINS